MSTDQDEQAVIGGELGKLVPLLLEHLHRDEHQPPLVDGLALKRRRESPVVFRLALSVCAAQGRLLCAQRCRRGKTSGGLHRPTEDAQQHTPAVYREWVTTSPLTKYPRSLSPLYTYITFLFTFSVSMYLLLRINMMSERKRTTRRAKRRTTLLCGPSERQENHPPPGRWPFLSLGTAIAGFRVELNRKSHKSQWVFRSSS